MKTKSSYLQELIVLSAVFAIVSASILNLTANPIISILTGFIIGTFLPRVLFKSRWNNKEFEGISTWKKYLTCAIPALIGSQIGWAALLI